MTRLALMHLALVGTILFASPRQLGPLIRMPEVLAKAPNSACKSRRSSTPQEVILTALTLM